MTNLLEKTEFAIPVFHAYGHKLSCQVQVRVHMHVLMSHNFSQIEFNPRNISGFGLSDGEVMERLWSYLRRFSPMTKEMRPSHRIDVLTDGLLHYSRRSARNMCKFNEIEHTIMFEIYFRSATKEATKACSVSSK